ncbi:hypothetical protein JCM8208_001018, partial [Rhodotorula glutinis]
MSAPTPQDPPAPPADPHQAASASAAPLPPAESSAHGLALEFDQQAAIEPATASPSGPEGDVGAAVERDGEALGGSSTRPPPPPARLAKEARFSEGPPETRTISPAPTLSSPRPSSSSSSASPRPSTSRRPSYAEPPSLTETHKDLRTLLKS